MPSWSWTRFAHPDYNGAPIYYGALDAAPPSFKIKKFGREWIGFSLRNEVFALHTISSIHPRPLGRWTQLAQAQRDIVFKNRRNLFLETYIAKRHICVWTLLPEVPISAAALARRRIPFTYATHSRRALRERVQSMLSAGLFTRRDAYGVENLFMVLGENTDETSPGYKYTKLVCCVRKSRRAAQRIYDELVVDAVHQS